jgi:hypothetical protein
MRKARVFISCGQATEREKKIGLAVEDYFKNERKFDTYFAERVHSSDALTENIFSFLQRSEYFIFIDFKREKLEKDDHRGSLFVNQEIAIATFLKLRGLGFYEKGVKREGILNYHIYNALPFEDGTEILRILADESKDWDTESVNELHLSYDPEATSKNIRINNAPNTPLSDWYHIDVRNRNVDKHAFSCTAYVTKIKNLETGDIINVPANELIWAGIADITVNIMASGKRELDAFYVIHNEGFIRFHQRPLGTNNPNYRLPDLPRGRYSITYTIVSNNFALAEKAFHLIFEDSHDTLYFRELESSSK